jgi:hypothetical protein
VALGNLRQGHSSAAITNNLLPIDIQPRTTDLATFKLCTSHTAFDTLDHQRSFQFRNRRDDSHEQTPHRIPGRHTFSAADELDPQAIQLVDYLEEIPGAPRNAVILWSKRVSHKRQTTRGFGRHHWGSEISKTDQTTNPCLIVLMTPTNRNSFDPL